VGEGVDKYAAAAEAAGSSDKHAEAIALYKKALDHAPGCDLYLMSIGCCYANLETQERPPLPGKSLCDQSKRRSDQAQLLWREASRCTDEALG